jgi:hypothetical protein
MAAVPSLVSSQSVLERVLDQIDGATNFAQINGTYANIAESGPAAVDTYLASAADSVRVFQIAGPGPGGGGNYWVTVGDLGVTIPAATTGFYDDVAVGADGTVTILNATDLITGDSYTVRDVTLTTTQIVSDTAGSAATLAGGEIVFSDGTNSFLAAEAVGLGLGWDKVPQYIPTAIDGSITNIITGVGVATVETVAGAVTAAEFTLPTFDLGNMSTTVLGAVNTGEIGLGTNHLVEEAVADASEAVRSTVTQVGTTVGSTQLAINSALNTSAIDGSISNTLTGVNGSVAAISPDQLEILGSAGTIEIAGLDQLLGTMSTTVLGAVNTGTIVSGVNNQVAGTVAGIVGNSATNMFSDAAAGQ